MLCDTNSLYYTDNAKLLKVQDNGRLYVICDMNCDFRLLPYPFSFSATFSIFIDFFTKVSWIIQLNYDFCPFLRQNVLFNAVIVQRKVHWLPKSHPYTLRSVLKYLTHVPLTHLHKFTSTIHHIPKSTYNLLCA